MVAANPLLGAGPLHFAHVAAADENAAHPHNWALQIASEWGIPALLCLLGALALGARGLLRAGAAVAPADTGNQHILAGLLATGTAIVTDGLLSGLIVMPQSQLMIALYLGLALGWSVRFGRGQADRAPLGLLQRGLAGLVLLGALTGLAAGTWPELAERATGADLRPAVAALNGNVHWPRLWHAGFF
jgi:hypothetical protein